MTLHMLQLEVRAPGLARWAHGHGIPMEDEGYLLHRLLRDAFGALAPQPFRWFPPAGRAPGRLLGYGAHDASVLRDALALAEPLVEAALPTAAIASKPMPSAFPARKAYGFEVRACPIVRTKRGDGGESNRELDVFLHRCLAAPDEPVTREPVYTGWLGGKLAAGGAEILEARVHRFEQAPLVRRRHPDSEALQAGAVAGRPARLHRTERGRRVMARRPDVTFRGTLRISDPKHFRELLARGVGRHRAFGYGMLLLRPAAPP